MSIQRKFKGKSLDIFPDSFVCVDIETTGLSPERDDIIEVSAVRVCGGRICAEFSHIINIGRPLPPFIRSLTGISDDMIRRGNSAAEVLSAFLSFAGDDILLGHNVNFDINFLYDNCLSQLDEILDNDFVDTLKIARRLFGTRSGNRLDDLMRRFGIDERTKHRALDDVRLTVECYFKMREAAECRL